MNLGNRISKWVLYPLMMFEDTIMAIDASTHKRITITNNKRTNLSIEQFNQVQILPSWVIFDIDPPKTDNARDIEANAQKQMDLISRKLQEANISHSCYHTGNTGRHILAIFKELDDYGLGERQWIKREIIRYFAEDYDIDLMKTSSKTLIQMPDTPHRKTLKPKHLLVEYEFGKNKIPHSIIIGLMGKRVEQMFRKEQGISLKLTTPTYIPPCYKKLESMTIPDGNRDNVLFILLPYWTRQFNKDDAWAKASDFVTRHDRFISLEVLSKKIEANIKSDRDVTCKYRQTVIDQLGIKEVCEGCMFK